MFGGGNGSDSGGESEEAEEEKTQRRRDWHAALNANSSVDRKRRAKEARKRYSYAAYADDRSRPPQQQRGSSFAAFAPGGGHASTFDRFDSGADDGGAGDGGDGIPLEGGVGGTAAAAGAIYREMDEGGSMSRAAKLCRRLTPQPVRHAILPPGLRWSEWKRFLFIHVPILQWLLAYRPKQLLGDAIAGITIGVTHIPQGIGFALLASLPPVYGLYSSFVPVMLYSLFGSSRHISVGTFPVVALMVGNAVNRIQAGQPDLCPVLTDDGNSTGSNSSFSCFPFNEGGNSSNQSANCLPNTCDELAVSVAFTLSFYVGVLMIVMGFLKLGLFITWFLSDALISGYTAAAAFSILVTQISFIFGLNGEDAKISGPFFTTPKRIYTFSGLIFTGQLNWAAVVTSLLCILLLVSLDFVNGKLRKHIPKVPIHIPAQLIVVILATGISYGANLNCKYRLPVIGQVGGIPPGRCFGVTKPSFSLTGEIITDAIVISIIGFVINISQAKLLARKNGYKVHPDQEFFAYGIMNLGGSFFGSFPTAGALSRTVLQDATGGNTQLVGFISSAIVIVVILALGSLFGPLPNAALAAIVVVALKGLYFQVRDTYKFYQLSWPDMFIWLVVFVATLLVGLDVGLGIGVGFSLVCILVRTILPFSPVLGETRAWCYPPEEREKDEDIDEYDYKVNEIPGILVFQFNSPLFFANADVFRARLMLALGLSLDGAADDDGSGKKDEAKDGSCFQRCCSKKGKAGLSTNGEDTDTPYVSLNEDPVEDKLPPKEESSMLSHPYHTIVIDCAPISFVDSMGLAMLEQVLVEFGKKDTCQVLYANPTRPICKALKRYGFFKRHSSEHLFPSVDHAVSYAKDGNMVPLLEKPEEPDIALASNLERQLLYTARPTFFESTPIELETRTRAATIVRRNTESSL